MHAKSGLRVFLKWKITRPDSVIADVIPLGILLFAPIVLPVQITFFVMIALVIGLPIVFRRFTKRPVLASIGSCAVLGLPLLFLVGAIVDSIRYGEFHHTHASKLNDGYVQLPTDASDITLHKYASGHELKFKTTRASLESWMEALTEKRREYSDATPFELEEPSEFDVQEFDNLFGDHAWRFPDDATVYRGWRSGRGAGFDVWYSDTKLTAFIHAGYW